MSAAAQELDVTVANLSISRLMAALSGTDVAELKELLPTLQAAINMRSNEFATWWNQHIQQILRLRARAADNIKAEPPLPNEVPLNIHLPHEFPFPPDDAMRNRYIKLLLANLKTIDTYFGRLGKFEGVSLRPSATSPSIAAKIVTTSSPLSPGISEAPRPSAKKSTFRLHPQQATSESPPQIQVSQFYVGGAKKLSPPPIAALTPPITTKLQSRPLTVERGPVFRSPPPETPSVAVDTSSLPGAGRTPPSSILSSPSSITSLSIPSPTPGTGQLLQQQNIEFEHSLAIDRERERAKQQQAQQQQDVAAAAGAPSMAAFQPPPALPKMTLAQAAQEAIASQSKPTWVPPWKRKPPQTSYLMGGEVAPATGRGVPSTSRLLAAQPPPSPLTSITPEVPAPPSATPSLSIPPSAVTPPLSLPSSTQVTPGLPAMTPVLLTGGTPTFRSLFGTLPDVPAVFARFGLTPTPPSPKLKRPPPTLGPPMAVASSTVAGEPAPPITTPSKKRERVEEPVGQEPETTLPSPKRQAIAGYSRTSRPRRTSLVLVNGKPQLVTVTEEAMELDEPTTTTLMPPSTTIHTLELVIRGPSPTTYHINVIERRRRKQEFSSGGPFPVTAPASLFDFSEISRLVSQSVASPTMGEGGGEQDPDTIAVYYVTVTAPVLTGDDILYEAGPYQNSVRAQIVQASLFANHTLAEDIATSQLAKSLLTPQQFSDAVTAPFRETPPPSSPVSPDIYTTDAVAVTPLSVQPRLLVAIKRVPSTWAPEDACLNSQLWMWRLAQQLGQALSGVKHAAIPIQSELLCAPLPSAIRAQQQQRIVTAMWVIGSPADILVEEIVHIITPQIVIEPRSLDDVRQTVAAPPASQTSTSSLEQDQARLTQTVETLLIASSPTTRALVRPQNVLIEFNGREVVLHATCSSVSACLEWVSHLIDVVTKAGFRINLDKSDILDTSRRQAKQSWTEWLRSSQRS